MIAKQDHAVTESTFWAVGAENKEEKVTDAAWILWVF